MMRTLLRESLDDLGEALRVTWKNRVGAGGALDQLITGEKVVIGVKPEAGNPGEAILDSRRRLGD
jgi:hypothetical protein